MKLRLSSSSRHGTFSALATPAWRRTFCTGLIVLIGSLGVPVLAQDAYPGRPITLVVGFAAGGAGDISSRFVADYFRERWKVPVIVENRPGAGSTIAAGHVARAKPDGYTVGLVTISGYTIAPHFQALTYNPEKDFTYLFQFLVGTEAMFVASGSPHKNAAELIAWARSNPGKMNWSTAATNGAAHVATAAAFQHLGITATYVPYKGGADALPALLGGQIDVLVAGGYPPFVRSGQVRLLAESGLQRIPGFPDVPTYKELGWPIGVPSFYGIAGPAGIPPGIVKRWEDTAEAMVSDPKFTELMNRLSTTGSFADSAGFTSTLVQTYRDMGRLIPALGLKGN
jgi:tripartite-type tricarboxylate transporter receptor subunit TctC